MQKKWVIADIHGCFKTLLKLIDSQIQPAQNDQFFFLGDYIDRGPKSKEVIDFLIDFSKQFQCTFLMGNHEEMFLKSYVETIEKKGILARFSKKNTVEAWKIHGGKETLESYAINNLSEIPKEHIHWFEKLPNYAQTENYLLVHAGFNFNEKDIYSDTHAMRWIRNFEVDYSKTNNRKVIHGHVPVSLSFIEESIQSSRYHFIDLDNGCVYKNDEDKGNLVALELETLTLKVQKNIDE